MARCLHKLPRKNWGDSPAWVDGILLRNRRVMGVWLLLAALSGAAPAGEFPGTGTNSTAGGASVLDAEFGVGSWIWDEEGHERREVHFWRTFEIPDRKSD